MGMFAVHNTTTALLRLHHNTSGQHFCNFCVYQFKNFFVFPLIVTTAGNLSNSAYNSLEQALNCIQVSIVRLFSEQEARKCSQ